MKNAIISVLLVISLAVSCSAQEDSQKPALKDVYKGYFLIGGALNRDLVTGKDSGAADIAVKHFNTATSENDMKWQNIHPQPNNYSWEGADKFVAFCEKNSMVPIGHCLIWHGQVPFWVFQGDKAPDTVSASNDPNDLARAGQQETATRNAGTFWLDQPRAGRDQLLERMREHIHTVVGHYKGRVKGWDVVNEALNEDGTLRNTIWHQIIGEGKPQQKYDHIAKAFEFAYEADPDCELYYNDYNLDTSKAKCDGAVELVKYLKAKGLRIDGVGIQLHAGLTYPDNDTLEYAIKTLSRAGVKVMITELDIRTQVRGYRGADISQVNSQTTADTAAADKETQDKLAEKYAELFSVFARHRKEISRVTFWGVYDKTSWIGGSPLLFDKEYKPKKAFDAVVDVVDKR